MLCYNVQKEGDKVKKDIDFKDGYFYYRHSETVPSEDEEFHLHMHGYIEVLVFLKGDADFIVESNTYPLKPYDIMIMKSNEMHQIKHRSNTVYERVVMSLTDSLFEKFDCGKYKEFFVSHPIGENNCIRLGEEDRKELDAFFGRMERYIPQADDLKSSAVIHSAAVEFLHFMNFARKKMRVEYTQNLNVNKILNYINNEISQELKLDDIAKIMYMSKYHLCRIFKQHTGLTINNYIANKRILLTREYHMRGMNLSEACICAGFPSYCSFYKTYHNLTGKAPKNDIADYRNNTIF